MRRKFGLLLIVGAALPLICAANASAQGAVMLVSPKVATPGQAVTVTGSGFGAGDVDIRLMKRNGTSVGGTTADTAGRISTTIQAPAGAGQYLLIGIQTTANGRQRAFTPGRTRLRVAGTAAAATAARAPKGGFGPALPIGADIGFLLLLAGGLTLTIRTLRRRQPLAAPAASSR